MGLKTLFHFKAKVIEPCSKLLSIFKHKNNDMPSRSPTFRLPAARRTKPKKVRTKTVRFRKPFSMKSLSFPRCRPKKKLRVKKSRSSFSSKFRKTFRRKKHAKPYKKPVQKVRIAEYLTVLFSLRKAKDLDTDSCDQVMVMGDVTSVSPSSGGGGHAKEPFPSPITPGYVHVRISDDDSSSKKESSSDDFVDVQDVCKDFENYLVEMIVEEGKVKDLMDVEELLYCWRNLKSPVFIDLTHRYFCTTDSSKDGNEEQQINVTFVETDGSEKQVKVPIGTSMLEAAHSNDVELEGACEGSCACSTCHVIVMDVDYYNKLPDPSDEENDMLDLAFGLTETSRLGCQIEAKPELDGIRLALPVATRNFAVDGYKPKPH
uniref:2Fe-2S ferredoxin-type domain-containing protein n=1 Tax=Chenopodium quinoa TaxID=63459 RepID=A0A803L5L7_CHEQI